MPTRSACRRRVGAVRVVSLAVAAALCAAAFGTAVATPSGTAPITIARTTALRGGDAVIGALPMNQAIHIEVALKLRNQDALDAFVANASQPPMTHAQFIANHAPTQSQAQAVADYLTSMGFHDINIAADRLRVSADGTALSAGNAFATGFAQVRTGDGRIAYANTSAARIPTALGDSVLAVLGLQNVHIAQPFVQRASGVSTQADAAAVMGHDPMALAAIHAGASVPAASNVAVGIVTAGSLAQTRTDLATFAAKNRLPAVNTQTVATGVASADTTHTDAWNLASQNIVGMAGGKVGSLIFYNLPDLSSASLLAGLHTIVTANQAKVIDLGMGLCEADARDDGSAAAEDALFEIAAAQGQTFAVASGNNGADACGDGTRSASWPAASRYVVAVAGTRLSAHDTWLDEVVWPNSGGSASAFEPKPSWQSAFMPAGTTTRNGADLAFDADPHSGTRIILNGANTQYGGTGLSSSLFTGAWARVLQQHPDIGFAGPALYALPAADFHDIVRGGNGTQKASSGYDAVSGRGSVLIDRMVADAHLLTNQPPVANFTFTPSGLTAHFTDASTDVDGKIAAHAWDFGDGGSATIGNPNHTYATTGTYQVTETVTDNKGATGAKTESVTVPFFEQLLRNTGFESATVSPWHNSGVTILTDSSLAHSGSKSAVFGGNTVGNEELYQAITIPAGIHSAKISFYLHETGTETPPHGERSFNVLVNSNGLVGYTDAEGTAGYVLEEVTVPAEFFGQTAKLRLESVNETLLVYGVTWYVDDVKLTVRY